MLALPEDGRAAALLKACADDAELRREVERLLQADGQVSAFFSKTAGEMLRDRR